MYRVERTDWKSNFYATRLSYEEPPSLGDPNALNNMLNYLKSSNDVLIKKSMGQWEGMTTSSEY